MFDAAAGKYQLLMDLNQGNLSKLFIETSFLGGVMNVTVISYCM